MGLHGKPTEADVAIYSLSHKPIGKSTQDDAYTASAHVLYITRASALHHLEAEGMPANGGDAASWLRAAEDSDRKNARVADKVMLALPRELTPEQRIALVRGFAEDLTKGRAAWLAAFHENTADARNPHCHLVLRDRDRETAKRVIGTSEKGSTVRIRKAWEEHANAALHAASQKARIDRRSLRAQGIQRKPTIHEGVRARRMRADGRTPASRRRWYRNGPGARVRHREVDYVALDQGRSRGAVNQARVEEYWAALDADRIDQEMSALRAIHHPPAHIKREDYRNYLKRFQLKPRSGDGRGDEREPDN